METSEGNLLLPAVFLVHLFRVSGESLDAWQGAAREPQVWSCLSPAPTCRPGKGGRGDGVCSQLCPAAAGGGGGGVISVGSLPVLL